MKKNILLLSNAYYPSIGGIENSLRHLAQEALANGDFPRIIVSDIGTESSDPNQLLDTIDGVVVKRYRIAPFSNFFKVFNVFISSYQHYKLLVNEKEELGDDCIVIARFHYSACLAYLAGFKNIKYLVPSIYRNQLKVEPNHSILQKIKRKVRLFIHNTTQRKALNVSENFVFSQTMKKQCVELTGDSEKHYTITKPGVDVNRFYPVTLEEKIILRKKLGLPEDLPIVLFVGRFVAAKGVSLLLEAFSKLETNALLVLVGEGSEYQSYLKQIEVFKLGDRVKIFPPTRGVEQFYKSADLFAMTSNYEPLGQTILEAMASGLKVVAFRPGIHVDTAIEELYIEKYVVYANNYSYQSLKDVLESELSLSSSMVDALDEAKQAQSRYSWHSLYVTLTQ